MFKHVTAKCQSLRRGRVIADEDKSIRAKISSKGHKDNNNRLMGMVKHFCIVFGTESTISMCGGHETDCTEVTFHRVAKFRVKHLSSDIERTRGRGGIILLVLLHILLILKFISRSANNQTINRPSVMVKSMKF